MVATLPAAVARATVLCSFVLLACNSTPSDATSGGRPGPTALRDVRVPEGLDFRTTASSSLTIGAELTEAGGELVHLRIALDPELRDPLFHGRVTRGRPLTLRLSHPRTTSRLFYEVFDERGSVRRGEVAL